MAVRSVSNVGGGLGVSRSVGRSIGIPSGVGLTLPLAIYAANNIAPKTVADFAAVIANDSLYGYRGNLQSFESMFEYTGASNKTMVDSDGLLKWAPHNLLTHSDDASQWSIRDLTPSVVVDDTYGGVTFLSETNGTEVNQGFVTSTTDSSGNQFTHYAIVQVIGRRYIGVAGRVFAVPAPSGSAGVNWNSFDTETETFAVEGARWFAEALGDGWYKIGWTNTTGANFKGLGFWASIDGTDDAVHVGDPNTGIKVAYGAFYRSDLGGMVDNPDRGDSYVPTTTTARYLPRRNHYKYNGAEFVNKGLRLESEARTNSCLDSREFDSGNWVKASVTLARNEVGIDGVSNTAYTITDTTDTIQNISQALTVADDNNPSAVSFYIGKTSGASTFPGVQIGFSGGTTEILGGVTVNTDDGTLTPRDSGKDPDLYYIENWSAEFWRVTVVSNNNGTGNTTLKAYVYPSISTTGGAVWDATPSGAVVVDQCDVNIGASVPCLPIITGASAVTRAAETLKIPAANMSYSGVGMSFQIEGEMDYADLGVNAQITIMQWDEDNSNNIRNQLFTNSSNTGQMRFRQVAGGAVDVVADLSDTYSPGLNVPFNVASRNTSGAINGAVDGTALTADTTPTALPDLSATDFELAPDFMGTIALFRQWDRDIADAGIEEATA